MTPAKFRVIVWKYYRAHGRHDLPWRQAHDLYKILVSEVMLQQTQVERVVPFYKKFIRQFPTAKKLAEAPLSEVLKSWQGLGYNRRAKMLHQAAKVLSETRFDLRSESPRSNLVSQLEKLPGVGSYTARAVAAFAYNEDVIFVETNIRTAVIHHFFPRRKEVADTEIEKILIRALPKGKSPLRQGSAGHAREWYSALMDYGAHLKRSGISHNARSKTYAKQSKFEGSLREVRGAILRELTRKPASLRHLEKLFNAERMPQVRAALAALQAEGLVEKKGRTFILAN